MCPKSLIWVVAVPRSEGPGLACDAYSPVNVHALRLNSSTLNYSAFLPTCNFLIKHHPSL